MGKVTLERGSFTIAAPFPGKNFNRDSITGYAQITALGEYSQCDPSWLVWAEARVYDMLDALSFACGINLLPRVTWSLLPSAKLKLRVMIRPDTVKVGFGAISERSYDSYLRAVSRSLEKSEYENIRSALAWMIIPQSHSEMRLYAAATTIENLIRNGLEQKDHALIEASAFELILLEIRKVLASYIDDRDIVQRLSPRNDVGLRVKVERLMQKWGAPNTNLPKNALRDAIHARNQVIHRGAYDDDQGNGVWHHAMVLREIVVRLVLARIGFSGHYVSMIGAHHERSFPECAARHPTASQAINEPN